MPFKTLKGCIVYVYVIVFCFFLYGVCPAVGPRACNKVYIITQNKQETKQEQARNRPWKYSMTLNNDLMTSNDLMTFTLTRTKTDRVFIHRN